MTIELNHTIVPSRDKEAAARFFARIFGLPYEGPHGHFAPVKVNDRLTLDFDQAETFEDLRRFSLAQLATIASSVNVFELHQP